MAQTSPLIAHADGTVADRSLTLIGTGLDPGTEAPIDTKTACRPLRDFLVTFLGQNDDVWQA